MRHAADIPARWTDFAGMVALAGACVSMLLALACAQVYVTLSLVAYLFTGAAP